MRVLKLKIWIRNMSDTLTLDPTHWPRNPVPAEMHRIECQCLSVMHWSAVVSLDTVGETSEHVVMSAAVFDTDNFHFVVGIHLYEHGICRSHFESHLPSETVWRFQDVPEDAHCVPRKISCSNSFCGICIQNDFSSHCLCTAFFLSIVWGRRMHCQGISQSGMLKYCLLCSHSVGY